MDLIAGRMDLAKAQVEQAIRGGSVYLDGRREQDPRRKLKPGQRLMMRKPELAPARSAEPTLVLAFKAATLAVVVKPAGLPCETTLRGGGLTLLQIVTQAFGRDARLLHRLDRVTSGLVLVSLDRKGRPALSDQIGQHQAARSYLAVTTSGGPPAGEEMTLDAPLTMARGVARPSSDLRAKPAETRVRTLHTRGRLTLVQATPMTGRTHQIRAHMSNAGWPILGDTRYGGHNAGRVCLHAHALGFESSPGIWTEVHAPMPADMRKEWAG